jgi:nucleoside-diphosphate-sugar epimerase
MKKILVIGGAGYVGTELSILLSKKYNVTVYDLFIYGDNFPKSEKIDKIKGDIRDIELLKKIITKDYYAIIHLACISNDPSFDLDPDLGKSINFDPFEDLVKLSVDAGVNRFIYASSSSVYGIKEEKDVNETFSLEPLTDYSKFKVMCEEILLKYSSEKFITCIIRPATVCGFSRRQRLDLVVNILTNLAYNKGELTVFGGEQLRPNIHIKDMCAAYDLVLVQEDSKINKEIFNVGFENNSVLTLAKIVKSCFKKEIDIKKVPTDDNRSYHISSEKIKNKIGFENKYTISDAVKEIIYAMDSKLLQNSLDDEMYFNIKRMKSINLK